MKKLALFTLTLLITISCEKDSFDDQYRFIYGDWTPTKIDTFFARDLQSFGNTVQFIENHQYKIFRDDILLEKGNIDILEQNEKSLTLRFVAKQKDIYPVQGFHYMNKSPLIVTVFSNDSIRMGNFASDGGYFCIWLSKKH